jgi:hypothetical protein
MVGLYSDHVIAIVKNVEMNFCLTKTEEELLKVDCFHLQSMARKGFNPMSVIGYDVG